jgi:hypothetical protein
MLPNEVCLSTAPILKATFDLRILQVASVPPVEAPTAAILLRYVHEINILNSLSVTVSTNGTCPSEGE